MNTTFQYQTTYGAPSPIAAPVRIDPAAPIYASEDGAVATLSNNECIFQVKRTGEAHVMTFQVLQALDQCREFRTLDEHAARIMTSVPGLTQQRDGVLRVLQGLAQRGLLVSDASFLQSLAAHAPRRRAPLRAVFVRAWERPAQLARLLDSLAEYERRHRANRPYVVLDDSTGKDSLDRHRDLVREFARTTGCKVTYIGPAERTRLVERLGKALPQQREVAARLMLPDAATTRFGGGRNWNLATLLSAGGQLVLLDDDQRLPLRRDAAARAGLDPALGTGQTVHFHANTEQALGAGEEIAEDAFALHLAQCGAGIGEVLGADAYPLGRESLRGTNFGRLDHIKPQARVLGTLHGTYGSARSESAAWLYHLDAEARAEFTASREGYLRNIEAQHLWATVPQARFAQVAAYTPFCLDNSELLPWCSPAGRGEDRLFSALGHFIHPDALILELPVAIGHVQESGRARSAISRTALTPRVNHFIADFVQRQFGLAVAEAPAQRLRYFGDMLRDLGGAGTTARTAHLREYLSFSRATAIDALQQQFEAAKDAPVYWQADVRSIIEANGKALLAKASPRLGDWSEQLDDAGCANALRDECNAMADYCDAWPAMWDWAREQGERLLGAV